MLLFSCHYQDKVLNVQRDYKKKTKDFRERGSKEKKEHNQNNIKLLFLIVSNFPRVNTSLAAVFCIFDCLTHISFLSNFLKGVIMSAPLKYPWRVCSCSCGAQHI